VALKKGLYVFFSLFSRWRQYWILRTPLMSVVARDPALPSSGVNDKALLAEFEDAGCDLVYR
jgi:hypothetical protein